MSPSWPQMSSPWTNVPDWTDMLFNLITWDRFLIKFSKGFTVLKPRASSSQKSHWILWWILFFCCSQMTSLWTRSRRLRLVNCPVACCPECLFSACWTRLSVCPWSASCTNKIFLCNKVFWSHESTHTRYYIESKSNSFLTILLSNLYSVIKLKLLFHSTEKIPLRR